MGTRDISSISLLPDFHYPLCAIVIYLRKVKIVLMLQMSYLNVQLYPLIKTLDLPFFFPGNTKVLQAHYNMKEWHCKPVDGKQLQNKLLNIVFFAPEYNAMALYHQHFRYTPCMCELSLFIIRLLHEAHPRLQDPIISLGSKYWCICSEPELLHHQWLPKLEIPAVWGGGQCKAL